MKTLRITAAVTASVLLGACSTAPSRTEAPRTTASAPAAPAANGGRTVKSRDGSFSGEIIGTPAPGSRFARLAIGMDVIEAQKMVGRIPDEQHTYESGKRWIPFYFGNDARRMQMLYKGEGCLVFTAGGGFSSGGDLIQIQVDPSGACYVP